MDRPHTVSVQLKYSCNKHYNFDHAQAWNPFLRRSIFHMPPTTPGGHPDHSDCVGDLWNVLHHTEQIRHLAWPVE